MFGKANIEIISPVDKGLKKKKFVQLCNCLQIKIPSPISSCLDMFAY